MNPLLIFASLLMIAPATAVVADTAELDCFGPPCDQINAVCQFLSGNNCLGAAPLEPECMGDVCDAINRVCDRLAGGQCVGAARDDMVQCMTVEPWYRYCTAAVGAGNSACDKVIGQDCLANDEAAQADAEENAVDCVGAPCDAINAVCHAGRKYLPDPCVR